MLYEKQKHNLEPNAILQIKGKLSIRDGEAAIILADSLSPISNDKRETITTSTQKTLYIKYNVSDQSLHSDVLNILEAYKGNIPVFIRNTATGNALKSEISVRDCTAVLNELNSCIGSENVMLL